MSNDETEDFPGLPADEAERRLRTDGPNSIPDRDRRGWFDLFLSEAREPMFALLAGAALLYLALGDLQEGVFLLVMVGVTVGLTFYQQGKTERALEALRALGSPRAVVIRGGQRHIVDSRDLVCGDVVVLAEGERVPADGHLLTSSSLEVDESLLTGESAPVRKRPGARDGIATAGGDDTPWVFSGTLVVRGRGLAEITATGARSELGRIGAALGTLEPEPGPLHRQSERLVKRLAILGLALAAAMVLLQGLLRGDWMQALLAGIAFAMSIMPEEFTIVFTVFPALGAWRLAAARVLTRRIAAIETLGAMSVLCADKTGTLTQNRMALAAVYDGQFPLAPGPGLPDSHRTTLRHAVLASEAAPYDPMETALRAAGDEFGAAVPAGWTLAREYPLTQELRAMAQGWDSGAGRCAAAKGAPEAILLLCGADHAQRARIKAEAERMAAEGLRVLGVASAELAPDGAWPERIEDLRWNLLGLVALADPLRAPIPAAVQALHSAGVRVMMVTGDYPPTARTIASQAGIAEGALLDGPGIDRMSEEELAAALRGATVCARIRPDQKLRIVRALSADGEIVGMTGDGVNDAPALKAAHAGIAMGKRGTDVAREAAALVLLDDQFEAIVDAVALGRRIYDNMRKAMTYILAIHIPIAGLALLPLLLGLPPLLYPAHIVLLEMIIDSACSLSFENEPAAADAMQRPPRAPSARLFDRHTLVVAWLQGLCALAAGLGAYMLALRVLPENEARAVGFSAVVLLNLALIFSSRAQGFLQRGMLAPNKVLWSMAGLALVLLLTALYTPFFAELFRFGRPGWRELGAALAAAAAGAAAFEVAKLAGGPVRTAAGRSAR